MANPFKLIFINFRTFSAIKVSGRLWESPGEVSGGLWGTLGGLWRGLWRGLWGGLWEGPLWRGVSRGPGVTREEKCVKTIVCFCIFLRDRPFRLENLRVTLTVYRAGA